LGKGLRGKTLQICSHENGSIQDCTLSDKSIDNPGFGEYHGPEFDMR
jgi:hypothetical protein